MTTRYLRISTLVASILVLSGAFKVVAVGASRSNDSTAIRNGKGQTVRGEVGRYAVAGEYYVTGRYRCVDVDDGSDRGSCDLTTRANSCQEALQAQRDRVNAAGDICKRCTDNVTDNTRKRSQDAVEWIHLGPCRGFPN